MRNLFNSVRRPKVRRNSFPLSFTNDFDTDFGLITPTMIFGTYAGEIWKMSNESFIRTQPLRAPAFMQSDVSYHWFFVPYRLVYDNWSKFIVRGDDGDTDYDKPYCTFADMYGGNDQSPVLDLVTPGSLFDFLNFPTFNDINSAPANVVKAKNHRIDMMPFNAYNLIYNEYYRDENLQPEVFIWSDDGVTNNRQDLSDYVQDVVTEYGASAGVFVQPWLIRHRAWRKDYFTSALPFVQKGSPISLFSTVAPASSNHINVNFSLSSGQLGDPVDWFLGLQNPASPNPSPIMTPYAFERTSIQQLVGPQTENHRHTAVTLGSVTTPNREVAAWISLPEFQQQVMTISDLRVGLALQQWFELNARTGSNRYFEYLLGHFGVVDRDSRMQRPEYIGGYSHTIQISEVEQNSSSDAVTPQGNLAGRGLGFSANKSLVYRCPEPGYIMCLQSIRPQPVYFQGWPRMYQLWDNFDYYDPFFDHLSEQSIKDSELWYKPEIEPFSADDRDFGYTPRFAHERTSFNQVHNNFRTSLNYWVSPRYMTSQPHLNSDFISIDGYKQHLYEMFAVPGTANDPAPHFICHVVNHVKAIRPMSKYATPYL